MADFYITMFLDGEGQKKIESVGLGEQIQEIDGKQAVQVGMTKKDQKKLLKGFKELSFDAQNACVLPDRGRKQTDEHSGGHEFPGCDEVCDHQTLQPPGRQRCFWKGHRYALSLAGASRAVGIDLQAAAGVAKLPKPIPGPCF